MRAKDEEILTDSTRAIERRADRHDRCARVWQRQTMAELVIEGICLERKIQLDHK
jgi:hypothetical protein